MDFKVSEDFKGAVEKKLDGEPITVVEFPNFGYMTKFMKTYGPIKLAFLEGHRHMVTLERDEDRPVSSTELSKFFAQTLYHHDLLKRNEPVDSSALPTMTKFQQEHYTDLVGFLLKKFEERYRVYK